MADFRHQKTDKTMIVRKFSYPSLIIYHLLFYVIFHQKNNTSHKYEKFRGFLSYNVLEIKKKDFKSCNWVVFTNARLWSLHSLAQFDGQCVGFSSATNPSLGDDLPSYPREWDHVASQLNTRSSIPNFQLWCTLSRSHDGNGSHNASLLLWHRHP